MTKFTDLKLDPKVLQAIAEAGYDSPTPIQAGAIPPALEGRDVLGIAQTGTGKTASFTLPMITLLGRGRARARMPRSLVLAPTRELAAQVAENFDVYAKHTRLTKALLIGGDSFGEQDKLIDRGVDVLIATPGRLLDHFERGKLLLTGVQIMVVDEADRMLDMGFIPDIERIFQLTPFTRQTLFFSATMAPEIERITDTFLHSPERIEVARQATTSETITQRLIEITPTRKDQTAKQKRELLRALIDSEGETLQNAIIFCNRKTDVDIVAKSLKTHGYDAAPIHGDLDQSQRMRTLDDFRDGRLRFLVASDVAARGLDIPSVSHVFNFDMPSHAEDYVHRIGRTGRAGRLGTAITIGTPSDEKLLAAIESLVKQSLPRGSIPEGFSLSAAAQGAPRVHPGQQRGGRNERNTKSRRHPRDHEHNEQAAMAPIEVPVAAVPAEKAAEPRREERRDTSRDERRDNGRRNGRNDDKRDEHRHDDSRGEHRHEHRQEPRNDWRQDQPRNERSRDNRREDRQPVLGMGDHVPDFMLRSFRPAILVNESVEDSADKPESEAEVVIEQGETERPASGRSRSRSRSDSRKRDGESRKRDGESRKSEPQVEIIPIQTTVTELPELQAEAPAPVAVEVSVVEAPAQAVAPVAAPAVTAETKVETAPEAASSAEAAAPAEAPVEGAAAEEAPVKKAPRKRAPRKTTKAEAPAAEASATEAPAATEAAPAAADAEAEVKKPVRKRAPRRKVVKEGEAEAAAPAAEAPAAPAAPSEPEA